MTNPQIKPVISKKIWNNFISLVAGHSFFQSWEWGEVSKLNNQVIDRLGIYDKDKLVGVFQITLIQAKRGNYIMLRHGPVLSSWNKKYLIALISYLKRIYKNNYYFIRVSPLIDRECSTLLRQVGFRLAPVHDNIDAQICYIVSIKPELNAILAVIRKNTRRSIKKAVSEKSLTIGYEITAKSIDEFSQLYRQTAQTKGFVEWSGIKMEVNEFNKNKDVDLIIIYLNKEPVAGAIINYWGNQGIYHYAAASGEGLKIQAQYLAIYEAIKRCKIRGLEYFNLWGGIEDMSDVGHPWFGLTVFKRGFGPTQKVYLQSYDYVFSFKYWKTYLFEQVVEHLRGYKKIGTWRSPTFLRRLFGV